MIVHYAKKVNSFIITVFSFTFSTSIKDDKNGYSFIALKIKTESPHDANQRANIMIIITYLTSE